MLHQKLFIYILCTLSFFASLTNSFAKSQQTIVIQANDNLSTILSKENTRYIFNNDHNLNGEKIAVGKNSTLVFQGGSISNGIINLNRCSIEGKGLNCNIINPPTNASLISTYLSRSTSTTLNTNVIQTLLDAEIPIIADMDVTFSNALSIKNAAYINAIGGKKVLFSFPNSRGFVWDKQVSSHNNSFCGLTIQSKGHAFDFVNSGNSNRPTNIYFSRFEHLSVNSSEGNCFHAGNNQGAKGDNSCLFDSTFEDIIVKAENGCGFYGISGNTMFFRKIRSNTCKDAVFFNCSGIFEGFNGTWGNTSTPFKCALNDLNKALRFRCYFINCNFESFKGKLFDCNNSKLYMHMEFHNCSFYITPNPKTNKIDYYPFDFYYLYNLVMQGCSFNIYNKGTYDTEHTLFRIIRLQNLKCSTDINLQVTDHSNNRKTIVAYTTIIK